MIINISGTSGSGKSTIARAVMARYEYAEPIYGMAATEQTLFGLVVKPRKRPDGYACRLAGHRTLRIVGHYEIACGGVDSLMGATFGLDDVYALVRDADTAGFDVLYEGLIVVSDVRRCAELHAEGRRVLVLRLTTSLADCLLAVQTRREARGNSAPLDPANTKAKFRVDELRVGRLRALGVEVREVTRDEALRDSLLTLGLPL